MGVQVQVLSSALVEAQGFTSMRRKPFFFNDLLQG